jgi:hypothetical protein
VETSGFGDAGVSVYSWAGTSGYDDVRITNVSAHDNLMAGIQVGGYLDVNLAGYAHRNVYIADCQVYNNTGVANHWRDTGFGIFLDSIDGAVIERNAAWNNGAKSTTMAGPMGIMAMESNNILMQFNESHHNHTAGGDGGGMDLDGGVTNSTIQYNYTHDNDGSGYNMAQYGEVRNAFSNNTVRYNISQNDGRTSISASGIIVWNATGAMHDCHIYNNTVYGVKNSTGLYRSISIVAPTTNFDVRNNVFMTAGGMGQVWVAAGQTNLVFQGNAYWGSGSPLDFSFGNGFAKSLADFRKLTGQEMAGGVATGLEVDPRLTAPGTGTSLNNAALLKTLSAYTPLPGSPLIDKGLYLPSYNVNPGPRDFLGNITPLGGAYDIGAVE